MELLQEALNRVEAELIQAALAVNGGNEKRAAVRDLALLHLYKKMR